MESTSKVSHSLSLKEAAQTALDVQDACNLSGVLASFHEVVMDVLWPTARELNMGTDWVNTHPIVTVFLDKLTDLNRRAEFFRAYDEVKKIAGGVR
jgi:hypothetical protein